MQFGDWKICFLVGSLPLLCCHFRHSIFKKQNQLFSLFSLQWISLRPFAVINDRRPRCEASEEQKEKGRKKNLIHFKCFVNNARREEENLRVFRLWGNFSDWSSAKGFFDDLISASRADILGKTKLNFNYSVEGFGREISFEFEVLVITGKIGFGVFMLKREELEVLAGSWNFKSDLMWGFSRVWRFETNLLAKISIHTQIHF